MKQKEVILSQTAIVTLQGTTSPVRSTEVTDHAVFTLVTIVVVLVIGFRVRSGPDVPIRSVLLRPRRDSPHPVPASPEPVRSCQCARCRSHLSLVDRILAIIGRYRPDVINCHRAISDLSRQSWRRDLEERHAICNMMLGVFLLLFP